MEQLYATASLRHLAQRRRLGWLAAQLPQSHEGLEQQLRRLAASRTGVALDLIGASNAQALLQRHWASPHAEPEGAAALPFVFVQAINLELTYGCNLACSHCLQEPLRPSGRETWLPQDLIGRCLEQAQVLGLLRRGLNVTGGETFRPGSPLLEVLAMAQRLGIPTRANTNAWWGLGSAIAIGQHTFASDAAVVEALQVRGLHRLALSLDDRYSQYPQLLDRVLRVCRLCESAGLEVELVCTGSSPELIHAVKTSLQASLGHPPQHLRLTPMELVDVGAAAPQELRPLRPRTLAALAQTADCRGHGFDRPYYLHVTPDGGVRSCLYAPGAGWLGNLHHQSLQEILNAAALNPVVALFAGGDLEAFVQEHLEPWAHLYRQPAHACTAAALIARLVERLVSMGAISSNQRPPISADMDMHSLHESLAQEMGLSRACG